MHYSVDKPVDNSRPQLGGVSDFGAFFSPLHDSDYMILAAAGGDYMDLKRSFSRLHDFEAIRTRHVTHASTLQTRCQTRLR